MSTQKTNVLEYEYNYFTMYSSTSTITLECNHDYFHDYFIEYPVSNIKIFHRIPRCHSCSVAVSLSSVITAHYPGVIIINNQTIFKQVGMVSESNTNMMHLRIENVLCLF